MVTHKTTQSYYACLSRTMLLMASEGNCWQKARSQLDPGAILSLVTSRLVHSVHAKIIKNSSVNISGPDYSSNCGLDLLLGMVFCNLCSQEGTVFSKNKACKAEKTIIGWAIVGSPQFSILPPLLHPLIRSYQIEDCVCDALAKFSNGNSLNDILLTGPSLYPLLTTTINIF